MADNDIHEREGVNSSNTNHFNLQTFRRQSIDEKKKQTLFRHGKVHSIVRMLTTMADNGNLPETNKFNQPHPNPTFRRKSIDEI